MTLPPAKRVVFQEKIKRRNMREASLVGMWAFMAIAVRQRALHRGLEMTALGPTLVLLIAISLYAYKYRKFNRASKLQKGEW